MAALSPFAWSTTLRKAEELLPFCQKVAEFARALSKVKLLDGQFLSVTFAATNQARARHSLGRLYVGAFAVTSTTPIAIVRALPASMAQDAEHFVTFNADAAFTGTLTVWVF